MTVSNRNWYFLFCIVGWMSTSNDSFSQQEPSFGEIPMKDLEMKTYALDTSASAIILYDCGDIRVEPTFVASTTLRRHIRLKILKKSGVGWGDFKCKVTHGGFSKLKGATYYLENGKVVKTPLEETSVFFKRVSRAEDEITIAFPNLKVGAVLECMFTVAEEDIFLGSWQFQYSIPVVCSEYSMVSPAWGNFFFLRGTIPFTKQETKGKDTYRFWQICNLPAFQEEPFMPDISEYVSSMTFKFRQETWEKVYRYFEGSTQFEGIIQGSKYLKDTVDHILGDTRDPVMKIKKITSWIKSHVAWDRSDDCFGDDPGTIIKKKTGSSGDINLMLTSMLKKAGFKVEPVLLSTRDNGYVQQDAPSVSNFNYIVCRASIDDNQWLLDATEKHLPYNLIPSRCFNHKGFVTGKGFYEWTPIEPKVAAKISLEAKLSIGPDNILVGTINIVRDGYAGFSARKTIAESGEEEYKNRLKNLGEMQGWAIKTSVIENGTNADVPFKEHYEATMESNVVSSGDVLYINPYVFLREELNPFKEEQRHYPVDFEELTDKVMLSSLTIPDGYVIDELPVNKIFALKDDAARCIFNVSQSENEIHVVTRLKINKTLFTPDEYPNLREFYTRIIAKKGENIVLRKLKK